MVLQYGDSERSFPKDSIFACKTKSVWRTRARTSICRNGIHCSGQYFTLNEVAMESVGRK